MLLGDGKFIIDSEGLYSQFNIFTDQRVIQELIIIFDVVEIETILPILKREAFSLWMTGSAVPDLKSVYEADYYRFCRAWTECIATHSEIEIKAAIDSKSPSEIWKLASK